MTSIDSGCGACLLAHFHTAASDQSTVHLRDKTCAVVGKRARWRQSWCPTDGLVTGMSTSRTTRTLPGLCSVPTRSCISPLLQCRTLTFSYFRWDQFFLTFPCFFFFSLPPTVGYTALDFQPYWHIWSIVNKLSQMFWKTRKWTKYW